MKRLLFDRKITLCPGSKFPGQCAPISVGEAIKKLKNGFWQPYADTCASLPKNEQQNWKANNAPLLVMAAHLRYRNAKPENLISHSGLICLDMDGVGDIATLKKEASALPYVVMVCKSISGTGIFCVVHIPECDADTHKRYYNTLQDLFAQLFSTSVTADSAPKSIASARYVSYDPDLYVNYDPKIFDELPPALPPRRRPSSEYVSLNEDPTKRKILRLVNEAVSRGIDITSDCGNKQSGYNEWLCIGGTLAALFGEAGRGHYHSLSSLSPDYSERDSDLKFTEVLRKGFDARVGAFINICKKYGLDTSTHFGEQAIPLAKRPNAPIAPQGPPPAAPTQNASGPVVFNVKPIQWGDPRPAAPDLSHGATPKPTPAAPVPSTAARRPVLELAAIASDAPNPVDTPTPSPAIWATPAADAARFPAPATKTPAEDRNAEIEALKGYFRDMAFPARPIKLDGVQTIEDPARFISGHLAMVEANNGNPRFKPYMDRLRTFKAQTAVFTFIHPKTQNLTA